MMLTVPRVAVVPAHLSCALPFLLVLPCLSFCVFLGEQHGEGGDGGSTNDENELEGLEKSFEAGVKLARGHRRVCLECFAPEGTPIQVRRVNTCQHT